MDTSDKQFKQPSHLRPVESTKEVQTKVCATPFTWCDPKDLKRREFVYSNHLIRGFVSVTVAPGGIGKTSLIIAEAVAMTSGKPLIEGSSQRQLNVWLYNLEDPVDEIQRRVQATCQYYDLKAADVSQRLFANSGRKDPLCIAGGENRGVDNKLIDALVEELLEKRIDVLIIDPFVSARGGGALVDGARSVRVLNRLDDSQAKKLNLENSRSYFFADIDKANLTSSGNQTRWFEIVNVELANGDEVGVVKTWWPETKQTSLSKETLQEIQTTIKEGEHRANVQSPNWVGNAIAPIISMNPKTEKDQIKNILTELISSGTLIIVSRKIASKGREIPFVIPGKPVK